MLFLLILFNPLISKIPIIILNWNGSEDTIECLQSIEKQTNKNFDLFLIDNNSQESDKKNLEGYIAKLENINYLRNDSNLGFAAAHNKIFEEYFLKSEYPFVLLLNNDTTVEPDLIDVVLKRLNSEPDLGILTCKMLNYYKPELVNTLGHKFLNTGEILPIANDRLASNYKKTFQNVGASGGAAVYSIDMLRKIGVFDKYFITGYEDAELGLRAMIAGYKLSFEPNALVYHKVGASIDKVRDYNFTLKIQLDILYTYFKLMPLGVIICNAPFYLFRTLVLMLLFLCTLRFKYFSIFFKGWSIFLKTEYNKAHTARNQIKPQLKLSWIKILFRQEFFFVDNFARFWKYFIRGKKTIFEVYKDSEKLKNK